MRVSLTKKKIQYYSQEGVVGFENDFYIEVAVGVAPNVNMNIFVRITGPDGVVFKDTDFVTPDYVAVGFGDLQMGGWTAPLDSFGNFLKGDYRFEVWTEQDAEPGSLQSDIDATYKICPVDVSPNIIFSVDCFCRKITLTDSTGYPSQYVVDSGSALELTPPVIDAGVPAVPVSDTALDPVTSTLDYTNVTWVGALDAYFNYPASTDGVVTVYDRITQQKEQKVDCQYNLCQLVDCIGTAYEQLKTDISLAGGFSALPQGEQDKWTRLNLLLQLHDNYITCQDFDRALASYNEIKTITGCSCKVDTEGPVPLNPLCAGAGGGGAGISDVQGNTPVVVNVVGGVATVSLSASFLSKFNALFNTTIVSADAGTVIDLVTQPNGDKDYTLNPRTYLATGTSGIDVSTAIITPAGPGQGEVTRFSHTLVDILPWVDVNQGDLESGFTYVGLSNPSRQFKIRYKRNALGTLIIEGFCLLDTIAYGGPFPLNTKIRVFTLASASYYNTNSVRYAPLIGRENMDDVVGIIRVSNDSGAGGLPGIEVLFNSNVGTASQVYFEAHFETTTGTNP